MMLHKIESIVGYMNDKDWFQRFGGRGPVVMAFTGGCLCVCVVLCVCGCVCVVVCGCVWEDD